MPYSESPPKSKTRLSEHLSLFLSKWYLNKIIFIEIESDRRAYAVKVTGSVSFVCHHNVTMKFMQDISEHAASMCLYPNTEHHHPQRQGKQPAGFFRSHRTETFHNIPARCSMQVLMEMGRWSDCCDNESADPRLRYGDRFRKTGIALASAIALVPRYC